MGYGQIPAAPPSKTNFKVIFWLLRARILVSSIALKNTFYSPKYRTPEALLVDSGKDTYGEFLKSGRTLRDPIHGDILLTPLEIKIIDTRAFQRLRLIRQLGCTHLVFPGAHHTRFEHSIGTLHSSQQLIDSIRRNPSCKIHFDPYAILLTRLCALLHYLAHIPFGHTLEDEGNLFPSQWKDTFRVGYFLGRNSEVGNVIRSEVSDKCLRDIVQILTVKSNADIEKLQYQYIADIIGDTFCADLLDYTRRDSYYVGLHGSLDLRLMRYISINHIPVSNREHVILELGKTESGGSEDRRWALLDLLRTRYRLMETVVHHRTKLRASAMIIDAVYDSFVEGKITKQMMCELGDDALLFKLERDGTDLSRSLIRKLRGRELHRPILELSYLPTEGSPNVSSRKEIFRFYNVPHNRCELQRKMENKYNLPEGSIIIYCPKVKDSSKSSTLMVSFGRNIVPLNECPDDSIREEIALIDRRYLRLFKLVVLIDSKDLSSESARKNLVEDCMAEFGL